MMRHTMEGNMDTDEDMNCCICGTAIGHEDAGHCLVGWVCVTCLNLLVGQFQVLALGRAEADADRLNAINEGRG